MSFTFDLCVLLYVIRLTGWLKRCSLSLSLSQAALTLANLQTFDGCEWRSELMSISS